MNKLLVAIGIIALSATASFSGAGWWRQHQIDARAKAFHSCSVLESASNQLGSPSSQFVQLCWEQFYKKWPD